METKKGKEFKVLVKAGAGLAGELKDKLVEAVARGKDSAPLKCLREADFKAQSCSTQTKKMRRKTEYSFNAASEPEGITIFIDYDRGDIAVRGFGIHLFSRGDQSSDSLHERLVSTVIGFCRLDW